jgi:hypothetical protein
MKTGEFRYPAYAPAKSWIDNICPNAPTSVLVDGDTLRWTPPLPAADGDLARKYVVYRFGTDTEAAAQAHDGTKVIGIVAANQLYVPNPGFSRFVVSALDKINNESAGALSQLPHAILCPNTGTSLPALVAGTTFSWQIFNQGNWEPLNQPTYFSGTNTSNLIITNLPVSFYGTQLRCVANGSIVGPVHTLKFGTTWTAQQNNQWNNAGNWTCGTVPSKEVDVTIPGHLVVFPLVEGANAQARSVWLRTGARINVSAGYELTISKD